MSQPRTKDVIRKLTAKDALYQIVVATFVNEVRLVELRKTIVVQTKIGVDSDLLFPWFKPLFFWKETACRRAAPIQHSAPQPAGCPHRLPVGAEAAPPVGLRDADSLFEYFLIDVEIGSYLQMSRIKTTTASAGVPVDKQRGSWMENCRLWEANRKVFHGRAAAEPAGAYVPAEALHAAAG
ncbi:hypothetical protein GGR58DRAFT_509394 [Xylaria digitata]|nr:hypothetical protein GGR58DRAFT_509394 [Xylaria digitata]